MKTSYLILILIGIASLGIVFALNYDDSPSIPIFESKLIKVIDYCNDTSPVKNLILYYHSNETHSIDNINCKWKLHENYPDSEILCIPYIDKWVTGEEWRNQTHIFNKDSCMWEKDPDYDELNSLGCPQFCPKDTQTYELQTDSELFKINYSISGAILQSIEKTPGGILDIQVGLFRDGYLKITIPDSLIVDDTHNWGGSYVVLANGMEIAYDVTIGESEQILEIPLLDRTKLIQILATYRISGTTQEDTPVVGQVNWLAENHSRNGHVAIQVIDSDMNKNPDEIEKFQIHIWSDSDSNGITPNVYETGTDTGMFETNIYFSEKISDGQRLHTLEEDLVFASYEDYTLPLSSNDERLTVIDSMIIRKTFVNSDDNHVFSIGDPSFSKQSLQTGETISPLGTFTSIIIGSLGPILIVFFIVLYTIKKRKAKTASKRELSDN